MNRWILCVAQGFRVGRIRSAPGTFGSVLGVLWVQLLIAIGIPWVYALATLLGIACSIWFCGRAEVILGVRDPGSVVLDEIVALPVCFLSWLMLAGWPTGDGFRQPLLGFHGQLWSVGIFVAFRVFDIFKPWPVRQSQALPGGWGVTIDDLLAAVYVNLTIIALWFILPANRHL